jgi:N-acetyl-1-D-myo-inositol-2-amino-2-deoxy-alpha-D-glucopyranoside deacetylase
MAVHAHPDDEVISTGGILARYADEGVRTVVVTCTDGSQGFGPGGLLPGEPGHDRDSVAATRRVELERSCALLGVGHLELLGYRDSGMVGWAGNSDPAAFCNAAVEDVAIRLARLIDHYQPAVVVTYDENGGYGHPDHIQTHRVALAAVARAGSAASGGGSPAGGTAAKVYFTARSQSRAQRMQELRQKFQPDQVPGRPRRAVPAGIPDSAITTVVDTTAALGRKRAALEAHASQLADTFWVMLSDPDFAEMFGEELFVRAQDSTGAPVPETDLFAGL